MDISEIYVPEGYVLTTGNDIHVGAEVRVPGERSNTLVTGIAAPCDRHHVHAEFKTNSGSTAMACYDKAAHLLVKV